jgi:hypothetical protein
MIRKDEVRELLAVVGVFVVLAVVWCALAVLIPEGGWR